MSRQENVGVRPLRISFVCTGNICRSPLAEALARHHLAEAGLDDWIEVESFGTHDYHIGAGADRRTVAVAAEFGIDLSAHRARQVTVRSAAQADLLFALDNSHLGFLQHLLRGADSEHLHLFLPWADATMPRSEVPDPYYGDRDGFVSVHRLLDQASRGLVERCRQMIGAARG